MLCVRPSSPRLQAAIPLLLVAYDEAVQTLERTRCDEHCFSAAVHGFLATFLKVEYRIQIAR